MATTFKNPAIQPGSTVLVTGVNGFIGSHVADQFLRAGYCVRGTARDTAKVSWIAELFTDTYGAGKFELFCVPDIAADGAFEEAVKGVSAFVHVASNVSFEADPAKVIPPAVDGALNALRAANGESSVKRYVLTSSSFAVLLPKPDTAVTVTKDTWNEESIRIAESPSNIPEQAFHNYAASKALAEKEVWRAYHEGRTRPDLVVNTVLPSANFGKSLSVPNQGHPSTSKFIEYLWKGENINQIAGIPPQYFIDVQDDARLHVAAAIHPGVVNDRIFAWAEPYNYDMILDTLRKRNPERDFIPGFQSGRDISVVEPRSRAEQLLRDLGSEGFTSLQESIMMNAERLL